MTHKPFAESCIENREPIFAVLEPRLHRCRALLEIGSGTGQHAVYFAPLLPDLVWQTSDMRSQHAGINAWIDEAGLANIVPPLTLDVLADDWPEQRYDAVFSANTAHIMSEPAVEAMFSGVGQVLDDDGLFLLYGPFNYAGAFTSPSNASFDQWLRQRDPQMGIRDIDWLRQLAEAAAMDLAEDLAMPVNNRTLVWRRRPRRAA
jgi:cyclopropane fatty-acyl-phospholipid synthase-like methyltransferase